MTNDIDSLVEEIAREIWNSYGSDIGPWQPGQEYWQTIFRNHARAMLTSLKAEHAH